MALGQGSYDFHHLPSSRYVHSCLKGISHSLLPTLSAQSRDNKLTDGWKTAWFLSVLRKSAHGKDGICSAGNFTGLCMHPPSASTTISPDFTAPFTDLHLYPSVNLTAGVTALIHGCQSEVILQKFCKKVTELV